MPPPFKVKAVFEYKSDEPDDLNFSVGQIITVTAEEDDDWYTGEYEGAGGKEVGMFPRNFVEKYEPTVPSRPVRNVPKPAQPQPVVAEAPPQSDPEPAAPPQKTEQARSDPPVEAKRSEPVEERASKPASENKTKQPPPVVEKPASSSFRDRIAAFNKAAAAPPAPFKPSGASSDAAFIRKPFVAPPPSRNSYVPPPSQAPPPSKLYRREEDPEMLRHGEEDEPNTADMSRTEPEAAEVQPKPTSLKDRIALLQQQQLEQAQKVAEKKKTKKAAPPPAQRADPGEDELERIESTEAPLTRQKTDDDSSRKSLHAERDQSGTPEHEVASPVVVSPPPRELVSDTNDADDSGAGDTEDAQEISTEEDRRKSNIIKSPTLSTSEHTRPARSERTEEPASTEKVDEEDEDEETEEDEDPDVRRRRELRERMAKMSGGMGMMGMFGPPGGMPAPSKKPKATKPEKSMQEETQRQEDEVSRAPPVPMMALPGMSTRPQQAEPEIGSDRDDDDDAENDDEAMPTPMDSNQKSTATGNDYITHQPARTSTDQSGPTSPYERSAPPPPPRDTRAPPPAPPSAPAVPQAPQSPPGRSSLPPPPPPPTRDENMDQADYALSPISDRASLNNMPIRQPSTRKGQASTLPSSPPPPTRTLTSESFNSTHSAREKHVSRPPPPPPAAAPTSPQARAPPPPPPGQPPSRGVTGGSRSMTDGDEDASESEEEVTEYDGDYDTDIASNAKHKDALKSYNHPNKGEDGAISTVDIYAQPSSPPARAVPPVPSLPPRDVPPPPPPSTAAPYKPRNSSEVPRAPPPPPPIPNVPATVNDQDEEYDPYRYSSAPQHGMPSPPLPQARSPPVPFSPVEREDDDLYDAPYHAPPPMPPPSQAPPVPAERAGPPPPPTERSAPPPPPMQAGPPMMAGGLGPAPIPSSASRQSMDVSRSATASRRSTEQARPSADYGFMATDIDLSEASLWWTQDNTPPPSIAARTDILFEVESNTTTKRGGKTTITRDVYILYIDYSQTTVNVSFDPNDPTSASINQSHQRPPPPPRQDQLESVSHSFGSKLAAAASQASGTTVADGSAQGLIWTLMQPLRGTALMPVGNRSFGAAVYANLGNASTQQFDEIRAGDIITFRNAKFAGHKGGLHQKYTLEAGQPGRDHVAVVIDWDGTKKKIRAWEQGRDEKRGSKGKVKEESFRVGDLKSGEVRVWRVMGRSWVGWDQS